MSLTQFTGDPAWSFKGLPELEPFEAPIAPDTVVVEAIDHGAAVAPKNALNSPISMSSDKASIISGSTNEVAEVKRGSETSLDSSASGENEIKSGPIFPVEIMNQIIKYAMTADEGGKIKMRCLTHRQFEPHLAIGLLRVSHAIYHEATVALWTENQFIFDHFGSDLRILNKPNVISGCMVRKCRSASEVPFLRAMRFELGSPSDPYMATVTSNAFHIALLGLRRPYCVEKLTLHFHNYSCLNLQALGDLFLGLQNVVVARTLTVTGPAKYYHSEAIHEIATFMSMNPTPTYFFVVEADNQARSMADHGFCYFRFKAAVERCPDFDIHEGELVECAARQGRYVDGFDIRI